MQDVTVPERWTQERRRQHTRDLLLDAAEEVFGRRGYEGASLDEIAETAGYTRGAIYKHFAGKEDLFLAANRRFNERLLENFASTIDPDTPLDQLDLTSIANQWHEMQYSDAHAFALGLEFNLFVLRHPEVRKRVASQRLELAQIIADFIDQQAHHIGATLRIPSITVARIALAASDGLQLAGFLDGDEEDLYQPFLELLLSAWNENQPKRRPQQRNKRT